MMLTIIMKTTSVLMMMSVIVVGERQDHFISRDRCSVVNLSRPFLGRDRTPTECDAKPSEHDIRHINQEAQKMLRRQTHRQNKSSGKPTTRSPGHSSEGIQHPRKAMRTRLNTTSGTRTRKQKLRAATQQNDSKP